MTDPRYTDPHKEPLLAPDDGQSGVWGWVAGVAILVLIAFVVIAGWNGDRNSASNEGWHPRPARSARCRRRARPVRADRAPRSR